MAPVDRLRTPFFVLAVAAAVLVVAIQLGAGWLVGGDDAPGAVDALSDIDRLAAIEEADGDIAEPPGRGIRHLALIDGLLLYTLALIGASLLIPRRIHGRIQGAVTMVVSLLWFLLALAWALVATVELVLMVSLFVSSPFGTMAYVAKWGFFPTGESALLLGLLAALKVAMAVFLILAHQRFMTQKGLVALVGLSVGVHLVLVILHGLFPRVVISMVDTFWAIVVAVIAAVYALVLFVGSVPSVVRAVRVTAGH